MADFIPISLPSHCKTYKDVDPQSIQARPYQGSDEIYLTQINPVSLEKNYLEVLKSVLRGVDPLQLTLGDRMYLILWEYVNSYSRIMKIKTVCTHCLSEVELPIDLGTLENTELSEDYSEPYKIKLPVSGEKIKLRLLTVGDEIEVEKYSKKHRKDAMFYRYARTIVDEESNVIDRVERLKQMAAKDFLRITSFQDDFFHGPEMRTTFTCPEEDCGEEDEVDIPFRFSFFVPDFSEL